MTPYGVYAEERFHLEKKIVLCVKLRDSLGNIVLHLVRLTLCDFRNTFTQLSVMFS